jgi:hypothetical protein
MLEYRFSSASHIYKNRLSKNATGEAHLVVFVDRQEIVDQDTFQQSLHYQSQSV